MKQKKLTLPLTKKQIYKIREFVVENGYNENCGKPFYLLVQPMVRDFNEKLDVLLLTVTQGDKLYKIFKKMKLLAQKNEEGR